MFSILVVVSSVLLVLVSAQSQCDRTYTVQEGDDCDSFSARYNVSTYQLAAVNDGIINRDCSNLVPGQVLCAGTSGQDCDQIHVVGLGDTCDVVAAEYNITVAVLRANNPQLDWYCGNMYIKEVVAVCATVLVPPPPSGVMPATTIPPSATPALPWCD